MYARKGDEGIGRVTTTTSGAETIPQTLSEPVIVRRSPMTIRFTRAHGVGEMFQGLDTLTPCACVALG